MKVELPERVAEQADDAAEGVHAGAVRSQPGGCPAESDIGHAKAIVPNIPVPLEGPVYFVSNGGEAFPNLVMVLQGYGVTIDWSGTR